MKQKKMSTTITIRISKTMDRELSKVAKQNERSKAFIIRSILANELEIPSEQARYDLEYSQEDKKFQEEFEADRKDTL